MNNSKDLKEIVIDIETIADTEALKYLPEPKASGTLKDPEKIKADIESKKKEQIEKAGLSFYFGKICCISVMDLENQEITTFTGEEIDILKALKNYVPFGLFKVISKNGKGFDLPFINFRLAKHGLGSIFVSSHMSKYDNRYHFDVQAETSNHDISKAISLPILASLLGFEVKDRSTGKDVQKLFTDGKIDDIKEHCESDVLLTAQIYERIKNVYE